MPAGKPQIRLQEVHALFSRLQPLSNFREPTGMGAVAGAQNGDAFIGGPKVQLFQVQLTARGPGIMGMDVEVGDQFHV